MQLFIFSQVIIFLNEKTLEFFVLNSLKKTLLMQFKELFLLQNINSSTYFKFHLNHLLFFNVSTDTTVILKDNMLTEKFTYLVKLKKISCHQLFWLLCLLLIFLQMLFSKLSRVFIFLNLAVVSFS